MRRRLDVELVRRQLAPSRDAAQSLISDGHVLVSGSISTKASRQVDDSEPVVLTAPPARFVSRGGLKLLGALEHFSLSPAGLPCLDIGASTGGFTDCLLQHGASSVTAIDVGFGQLHERMAAHPLVHSFERLHVRDLAASRAAGSYPFVVGDLSFISLVTVAPYVLGACAPGATVVLLIKPQFEAGRAVVSKGRGIVTDEGERQAAIKRVADAFTGRGATMHGVMTSPITGTEGNIEYLAWLSSAEVSV